MLEEHMIDMEADYGEMWTRSWRCFNCGHRDDAVLQRHRQSQATPLAIVQAVAVQDSVELSWKSEASESLVA